MELLWVWCSARASAFAYWEIMEYWAASGTALLGLNDRVAKIAKPTG
jgi:hypothetical protein